MPSEEEETDREEARILHVVIIRNSCMCNNWISIVVLRIWKRFISSSIRKSNKGEMSLIRYPA